jgi:pimeloyl-ACP methyl ester carboxylesterase
MPIVFVHGLFPTIYQPPAAWLCPLLPGYGEQSGSDVRPPTLPIAADYFYSLLKEAGTEKFHLVGHSIGGAIAVILAARHPESIASVVSVEGNFTLKDAFWSSRLARMTELEAASEISILRSNPTGWLVNCNVPVTRKTRVIAERSLLTSPRTIHSMARSVVEITAQPEYLHQVRKILNRGIPFHLIAGEHSRPGWDVPEFVLTRAASFQIQPGAGHMLMLNDQHAFVKLVERAIARS